MFNYFLKGQNSLVAGMDFELANDFKKAILDLNKSDSLFNKKKLFYEAIFLDLTDRTERHPRINFEIEDKEKYVLSTIYKATKIPTQILIYQKAQKSLF